MQLIADGLAAERSGEIVVADISFALGDGEALVITGANGSGKSTLLRVIAGLMPPAAGSVRIEGSDEGAGIAELSHYLGHKNAMKPPLTVTENLAFWRDFAGEPHLAIADALDMVGLSATATLPYGYLSTGQRRRIAIARLLVSYRPIWLLDEPTAGLDADSEAGFAELMGVHLEDGGIIVAATHQPLGLDGAAELKLEAGR